MNPIDLAIVILLIAGFAWGFSKGFIYMIFSLLAIIGGLFVSNRLAPLVAPIFPSQYSKMGYIIVFIIIFIIIYVLIKKLTYLLNDMVEFLELEWLDSLIGGVIGLVQFIIIIGVIISVGNSTRFFEFIPALQDSKISYSVSNISMIIINFIAGNFSSAYSMTSR
jgi:uncharacterized membrane protein required for colicin V production